MYLYVFSSSCVSTALFIPLYIQFYFQNKKKERKTFSFTSFFSPLMSPGISLCKLGLCVQINYIFWWFFAPNWWHFRWRYRKYIIKHDEYQNKIYEFYKHFYDLYEKGVSERFVVLVIINALSFLPNPFIVRTNRKRGNKIYRLLLMIYTGVPVQ